MDDENYQSLRSGKTQDYDAREPRFAKYIDELNALAFEMESKLEPILLQDNPQVASEEHEQLSLLESNLKNLTARYTSLATRISL